MKVLIIDDHPTDLKLIGDLFRMDGHVVHQKASSEGVLAFVVADRPDVIVLDLRLPGSDGLTLARQIKADPSTAAIPIVAVTAYPESYTHLEVLSAGCDAYIVKPFDTRQLSKQVEQIVLGHAWP